MAFLTFSQSIAAGATVNPFDGWQYEYVPRPGLIKVLMNATAPGLIGTVTSGSDTLMESGPITAGGTAGVLPPELSNTPLVDAVMAGDRLKARISNPTGGAITLNFTCDYTPA